METITAARVRWLALCSYPTYEEWKLQRLIRPTFHQVSVLILPMRNGNIDSFQSCRLNKRSSYPTYEEWKRKRIEAVYWLWINCSYPTYEEWKPLLMWFYNRLYISVLILPMRNGNKLLELSMNSMITVLILPMRNGNTNQTTSNITIKNGSYPTYEEWKHWKSLKSI